MHVLDKRIILCTDATEFKDEDDSVRLDWNILGEWRNPVDFGRSHRERISDNIRCGIGRFEGVAVRMLSKTCCPIPCVSVNRHDKVFNGQRTAKLATVCCLDLVGLWPNGTLVAKATCDLMCLRSHTRNRRMV